jgi:hypothetical protein
MKKVESKMKEETIKVQKVGGNHKTILNELDQKNI